MNNNIWEDFFTDRETENSFASSEVFQNYAKIFLEKEANEKVNQIKNNLENENELLDQLENFRDKIEANPVLKMKLIRAKKAMEENPELMNKVDPNFINGLEILDLDEEIKWL